MIYPRNTNISAVPSSSKREICRVQTCIFDEEGSGYLLQFLRRWCWLSFFMPILLAYSRWRKCELLSFSFLPLFKINCWHESMNSAGSVAHQPKSPQCSRRRRWNQYRKRIIYLHCLRRKHWQLVGSLVRHQHAPPLVIALEAPYVHILCNLLHGLFRRWRLGPE